MKKILAILVLMAISFTAQAQTSIGRINTFRALELSPSLQEIYDAYSRDLPLRNQAKPKTFADAMILMEQGDQRSLIEARRILIKLQADGPSAGLSENQMAAIKEAIEKNREIHEESLILNLQQNRRVAPTRNQ